MFASINTMDVTYLSPNSVRIKGKQVNLLVAAVVAEIKTKIPVEASLLIGKERSTQLTGETTGILFQGAGEYEVKGTKITGFSMENGVMFTVHVDNLNVFVGTVSSAVQAKDKLHEHDMAILFADEVLGQTTMGILNASVLVFVGEKAEENAKAFDKPFQAVGKYAVTKDKLPQETEFVFLG